MIFKCTGHHSQWNGYILINYIVDTVSYTCSISPILHYHYYMYTQHYYMYKCTLSLLDATCSSDNVHLYM